jgi:hypothetical protein
MRKLTTTAAALALVLLTGAPATAATSTTDITSVDPATVEGLTAEQVDTLRSVTEDAAAVEVAAAPKATGKTALATGQRRATYYRGSFLMWTRDNVDFGYDWTRVRWTSPYQQAGWVFPNIARNKGISKYYDTTRNDRFRAVNTIGAGTITPWGDVKLYSSTYTHRLSVHYNGAWSAWSD